MNNSHTFHRSLRFLKSQSIMLRQVVRMVLAALLWKLRAVHSACF